VKIETFSSPRAFLQQIVHPEQRAKVRYPAQFILINDPQAYRQVIRELQTEFDPFRLSNYCDEDTFPQVERCLHDLRKLDADQDALLLPLSELLRLAPQMANIAKLATWERVGAGRVFVPILGAIDRLLGVLNRIQRYAVGEIPIFEIKGSPDVDQIEVIVAPQRLKVKARAVEGIRAYLQQWENGNLDHRILLITPWAPYLEPYVDIVNIRIYGTCYAYLAEIAEHKIERDWGEEGQWAWLAGEVEEGESLDRTCSRLLNIVSYQAENILALWNTLDEHKRWLAWLWAKLREPPETVLGRALERTLRYDQLEPALWTLPFYESMEGADWEQRLASLERLQANAPPPNYIRQLQGLGTPLERLQASTGRTEEERALLVQDVGALLKEEVAPEAYLPLLHERYRLLAWYLSPLPHLEIREDLLSALTTYFAAYTRSKLRNCLTSELEQHTHRAAESEWPLECPSRHSVLSDLATPCVLWEDGLGMEWAGLIWRVLMDDPQDLEAKIYVVRAQCPTTTPYNVQDCPEGALKGQTLDELAHREPYRFPNTLVKQLAYVEELAHRLAQWARERGVAVLTGDHGLTRFARFPEAKIPVPEGYKVGSGGRYAQRCNPAAPLPKDSRYMRKEGDYVLLTCHGLFEGTPRNDQETHGGATPEELLVPVIQVRLSKAEPVRIVDYDRELKADLRGHARLHIQLDRPIEEELTLAYLAKVIKAQSEGGARYAFDLEDLAGGHYHAKLECGLRKIGEIDFEVIRGIRQRDLGL